MVIEAIGGKGWAHARNRTLFARKFYGEADDVNCTIDRMTGDIEVSKDGTLIDYREFGRIAAQTAKQVLIQKIRENERTSIYDEYAERKGQIITGSVSRFEGGALIVNVGRSEGFPGCGRGGG